MRDARVEELEQKNTIVEQGVTSVSVQPQNDEEVLLSIDIPISAVNVPSFVMDQKSSERKPEAIAKRSVPADREMDIFWMRYIRKRILRPLLAANDKVDSRNLFIHSQRKSCD
ncbi:uncharacterized protein OCT59_016557 [Rhizophagus irregularis]|uniref:uncharacterized protein n=1 Tax=Rhizophagus irregularis TaxID=588596 RepID=UPI000CBDCFA5|nr:hypothetical protein OCT59_016557 [Rhizophagus irregularis]GBC15206.1 hypothetical protein GLOIN_2v1470903 [Rhizophagus irregularis DAOM 181602=DAOM 197198]CAB4380117.1 unnamed protein product [Rhizophagus irregularis]CAB5348311.1 unnamed protein product [Rhizophagus irregularis]